MIRSGSISHRDEVGVRGIFPVQRLIGIHLVSIELETWIEKAQHRCALVSHNGSVVDQTFRP